MSNLNDKKELLKLKQGILEESGTITEQKPPKVYDKPKGFKAKFSNYWYHYKMLTIGCVAGAIIISVLVHDLVTSKTPDLSIAGVADNYSAVELFVFGSEYFEKAFLKYTPDFDNNGYRHVVMSTIDLHVGEFTTYDIEVANRTKLAGEIQRAKALIFLGNKQAFHEMSFNTPIEEIFVNLSEIYTDCEFIEDDIFYKIKGSPFETALLETGGIISCPDDLYLAMRKHKDTSAQTIAARTVMDNIINNNIIEE